MYIVNGAHMMMCVLGYAFQMKAACDYACVYKLVEWSHMVHYIERERNNEVNLFVLFNLVSLVLYCVRPVIGCA